MSALTDDPIRVNGHALDCPQCGEPGALPDFGRLWCAVCESSAPIVPTEEALFIIMLHDLEPMQRALAAQERFGGSRAMEVELARERGETVGGCEPAVVHKNGYRHRNRIDEETLAELWFDRRVGNQEIAVRMGHDISTLRRKAKRLGWKTRRFL